MHFVLLLEIKVAYTDKTFSFLLRINKQKNLILQIFLFEVASLQ
jgi:hypothetical protein